MESIVEESVASLAVAESGADVKPYQIRVSSRYLELTKQKLDLTRLPHTAPLLAGEEWEHGTPKRIIEPLIDYWLESYDWREREQHFNTFPQFRLTIPQPPNADSTTRPVRRIHFIHIPSPSPTAIPLLLLPPFPLTNVSLLSVIERFASSAQTRHRYHIVAPSLPGLGFSDALPVMAGAASLRSAPVHQTASILNNLMCSLTYNTYIVSTTSETSASPAHIDFRLAHLLATTFEHCVGVHHISPHFVAPRFASNPWSWLQYRIARIFHGSFFGYTAEDWRASVKSPGTAPTRSEITQQTAEKPRLASRPNLATLRLNMLSSTLAYSLCDSPTGFLAIVLGALHLYRRDRRLPSHVQQLPVSTTDPHVIGEGSMTQIPSQGLPAPSTPPAEFALESEQIIDIVQMAWLAGPESALHFWRAAIETRPEEEGQRRRVKGFRASPRQLFCKEGESNPHPPARKRRPAAAITVFTGPRYHHAGGVIPDPSAPPYVPPAWGARAYDVIHTTRRPEHAGLLAYERPDVIVDGVSRLTEALLERDVAFRRLYERPEGEEMV